MSIIEKKRKLTEAEIAVLVRKHRMEVVGEQLRAYNPKGLSRDLLAENKQDIIAYIRREAGKKAEAEAEAARKFSERQAKIDAIDGLKEIKAALADRAAWRRECLANIERGDSGVGLRSKPKYDIEAMLAAHPQAAAYLKAEAEADKVNYELSAIGSKALDRVIDGDYEQALVDMEAEIKKFTQRHMWD